MITADRTNHVTLFDEVFTRPVPAYGTEPSPALNAFLRDHDLKGQALDLGAGAGRDSFALLEHGFFVTAIDQSAVGLSRLRQRSESAGYAHRLWTLRGDVRQLKWSEKTYDMIVATTILDHLPVVDAKRLFRAMISAMDPQGYLFIEVHTTDDPGSPVGFGAQDDSPKSETSRAIEHYFLPQELLRWAVLSEGLRVVHYEERVEWDSSHGPVHKHGKASLIATSTTQPLRFFGLPCATDASRR